MTVIEKIKNLMTKAGFLTSVCEFLTIMSFLYGKVAHIDEDSKRLIWLWCCAIFAGFTLLFGGIWIGLGLSNHYTLLGDDDKEE